MPRKSFTIEREALEVFNRAKPRERETLLAAFDSLRDDPEQGSDSVVLDDVGRRLKVVHHGRFAIFWWDDFTDRRLRIVALEKLD